MAKRTDTFSLNPYTSDVPPIAILPAPLPESLAGVRYKVIQTGYSMRLSLTKPYPDSGWRWHYAYRAAKKNQALPNRMHFFRSTTSPMTCRLMYYANANALTKLKNCAWNLT